MNKKYKAIALTLVFALMLSLMPVMAFAADEIEPEEPSEKVAKIGEEEFETLQGAIDAAKDGDTIEILKDFKISDAAREGASYASFNAVIDKSLNIDGNDNSITVTRDRGIAILGADLAVNISDLSIISENDDGPICLQIGSADAALPTTTNPAISLVNTKVIAAATNASHSQPISIYGGTALNASLSLDNCEITMPSTGYGYGIILFGKTALSISDSEISGGYSALYFKGIAGRSSSGSVVAIDGSTLSSVNPHGVPSNNFATIVFEGSGESSISLNNTVVEAITSGEATQRLISFAASDAADKTATITGNCEFIENGENAVLVAFNSNENANNKLIIEGGYYMTDPSPYLGEGFVTLPSDKDAYTFMVGEKSETAAEVAPISSSLELSDELEADPDALAILKGLEKAESVVSLDELELMVNDLAQDNKYSVSDLKDNVKAELKALAGEDEVLDDAKIVYNPYIEIVLDSINASAESGEFIIEFDISAYYDVLATFEDELDELTYEGEGANAVLISEKESITINESIDVRFPIGKDLYEALSGGTPIFVKHSKNNTHYYYPASLEAEGEGENAQYFLCFTSENGFSPFKVFADGRSVDVQFNNTASANDKNQTYDPTSLGTKFPSPTSKSGYNYTGWQFFIGDTILAVSGKTLTNDLLTKLYDELKKAQEEDAEAVITAEPKYSAIPSVPDPEPEPEGCDGGDDCPSNHLEDVDTDKWYHEAIDFVVENEIMVGTDEHSFSPEQRLSRAMMAQLLFNYEGKPQTASQKSFSDVKPGAWYYDAVIWAAETGVAIGFGDGSFNPNEIITREQMAVMLYNYCSYKKITLPTSITGTFADEDEISPWAKRAVLAMYSAKILSGRDDNKFDPKGFASRAEVAQMMHSFVLITEAK
ncbi:S-layer homology domain-containing protein [Clostridiaceae bacterium OttesenSCG-928-D20]|nr:S-layer homology domain-containing protein [Clostridiaceae bacterium OttesenSCG-928-D20]